MAGASMAVTSGLNVPKCPTTGAAHWLPTRATSSWSAVRASGLGSGSQRYPSGLPNPYGRTYGSNDGVASQTQLAAASKVVSMTRCTSAAPLCRTRRRIEREVRLVHHHLDPVAVHPGPPQHPRAEGEIERAAAVPVRHPLHEDPPR